MYLLGLPDAASPHIARIKRELGRESHTGTEAKGVEVVVRVQKLRHRRERGILSMTRILDRRLPGNRLAAGGRRRDR